MASTLYHAVNISDSPAVTTDKLNDSICSHVIVKSGFVYYKTLFKGLQRFWCRLHREADLYPRQLVLYELLKHKKKVSHLIPLDNVLKVLMEDDKCQINILTSSKKFSIKTTTLEEATAWTQAINQEVFGPPLPGVIYRFRVRTDRSHLCKGMMADYLLKVYDDKIELYTSNGKILTDFSCDLNEIHRIKYLSTKLHKTSKEYLSIITKDAHSNYQEKEILVMQAKSPIDLCKVINHRKRLLTDEHSEKLGSDATMAKRSSISTQQKTSSSSTDHVTGRPYANIHTLQPSRSVEEEYCAKAKTVPPCTRAQHRMSDAIMHKPKKSHPLVIQLMRKISTETEGCRMLSSCEDQSILNTSRSLQDISNRNHLQDGLGTQFNSDLDVTAFTTSVASPLYANLPVQVPLAKNTVMTKICHDTTRGHNSTSSLSTTTEEIPETVNDLASPKYYTVPAEVYSIATNDDSDSDEDDGLYVIDQIDQYLEILPVRDCDDHLYESITGIKATLNFNKDDCVYDYVTNSGLCVNHNA